MKKLKSIVTIIFLSLILMGMSSCAVRMHTDNGRHRGWFQHHDNRRHQDRNVLIIGGNDHDNRSSHKVNKKDSWDREK